MGSNPYNITLTHINLGKPEGFFSVSCEVWWEDFDSDTRVGRPWPKLTCVFFFAVELCRFTSLFRQDRRVQGHASRVGGRLFRVYHRVKQPHLLPHSLSFPRKKEGCSPCTSQFELSPLRTTDSSNVGSDVGF